MRKSSYVLIVDASLGLMLVPFEDNMLPFQKLFDHGC
jgi:hypothetical protein